MTDSNKTQDSTLLLQIEVPSAKKGSWVYASRFRGQSLRDWVIQTLDAAVPEITEDDEALLHEWLNAETIEIDGGEVWYSSPMPRQQLTESKRIEYLIYREGP